MTPKILETGNFQGIYMEGTFAKLLLYADDFLLIYNSDLICYMITVHRGNCICQH